MKPLDVEQLAHDWVYDTLKGTEHDLDSISASLSKALGAALEDHRAATDAMQGDLAEILGVCGLGDHARPVSPHRVVHDEILPRLREMRDAITWEPDHA